MSIESIITRHLIEHGMFPQDASAVIIAMKADSANKAMLERWQDDAANYPLQNMTIAWYSAKQHALAWIDANCPEAWYRPMFESNT